MRSAWGKGALLLKEPFVAVSPSSALVFSLSKVTLKAARHAEKKQKKTAYLFNMQTFAELTSALLCYVRSLPLQRNKLGRRPTHYRSKMRFHI